MASLAKLVKDKIKEGGYEGWIASLIEEVNPSSNDEVRLFCPAHDNTDTESASFNVETGLWHCFNPECGAQGDAIEFYRVLKGIKTPGAAIRALALELGVIVEITSVMVQGYHENLILNPPALERCCSQFGISPETVKHFNLGLVKLNEWRSSRFGIPIRGESGWEDIRCYNHNAEPKIIHYAEGHGAVRVFPRETLEQNQTVILFEGEKDTLRAWDLGVKNAITVTGSAGSLPHDYDTLFKGKVVYICFDIDQAGVQGRERVARRLLSYAKQVHFVSLPITNLPENGDFSDWANLGNGIREWEELVANAEQVLPEYRFQTPENETEPPLEVTFSDIQHQSYFNQPVRFLAHSAGKSIGLDGFQLPTLVTLACPQNQGKLCKRCALRDMNPDGAPWEFPVNPKSEIALKLFRTPEDRQERAIKDAFGVAPKCEVIQVETRERKVVQHLFLSPPVEIASMREFANDGTMTAYYSGPAIGDNHDFWFEGSVQADPKSQKSVLNLHSAAPARNAIDHFEVDDSVYEALDWFRVKGHMTVADHLQKLHRYVEEDIGIWGMYPLQQALFDATFSVRHFWCKNREIENGHVEVLIIGDTGVAKSTASKRWLKFCDVGEFINAETVSLAGLIGGIEFIDKIPVVKWGALPRNHRGLVVLDEIDEMQKRNKDITAQLTALRSSGVAEITKINAARTPAQVRMVWITNPSGGEEIATFDCGCRAIEGVINNRQDVARFTKALAVSRESVDIEVITQDRPRVNRPMVQKHFNNLAILAWSLQPDQVQFTDDAFALVKRETERLLGKYSEAIPLLEKGRAFDKVAKLSVPVAVLCGAFTEKDGKLTLNPDTHHVDYAVQELEAAYDDPSMGYNRFSAKEFARALIPNAAEVEKVLRSGGAVKAQALVAHLLSQQVLSRTHIEEFIGDRYLAHPLWSALLANNCLTVTRDLSGATKTKPFVMLLERLAREFEKKGEQCSLKN